MLDILDKWDIFKTLSDELKRNIRHAFANDDSAIYVTKDDEVFGFGKNLFGFLGTGDRKPRTEHTKIDQLCGQNIQDLQFSEYTFFAISASGSVFAWGRNADDGQLGLGTYENTWIPTKIEGILATKRVVQVACSHCHTLALTSEGEVFSFSFNQDGQLGLGHGRKQNLPMKLDFPAAGRVVTSIACDNFSSLALLDTGEVFAWGDNPDGILGQSEEVQDQNIPCRVPGLNGITITRIVCGTNHVLALSNDGKVYSWGCNFLGQLGNGTLGISSHQPTLVSGIVGRVRDVATYYEEFVSAAVTEADEVYVWGCFYEDEDILIPKKTSFTSLEEVFAHIPFKEFKSQADFLDESIGENNTTNESDDDDESFGDYDCF